MKWKNKGNEFELIAENILKPNTKYMLWGAGKTGKKFLEKFKNKINIVGIIDSATDKIGDKICNYEIVSFEDFKKEKNVKIIITMHEYMFDADVLNLIKVENLKENYDYIYYHTYEYVYNMYIKNKLVVPYIRIPVTERCTLRCKDCISRMTEFEKPKDYNFEDIVKDIDSVFNHIDYVENFRFVGGEPFLNKRLIDIIEYTGEKYYDKIGNMVIVSNGTIIPETYFFETMNRYRIILRISNYKNSIEISSKQKINEIGIKVQKYENINLEIAIDDGVWHKYSINRKDDFCEEELIEFYDNCICAPVIVKDKKLYACVWHAAAVFLDELENDKNDYFDLEIQSNRTNRKILMEFLLKFTDKGYINGCKYCIGEKPIHHRFISAAIQVK